MVTAGLEIVFGSPFNDVITAAGATVPVQINGLNGDDDLTGGDEADVLRGGNDNDTLTGGPEDDALLGQAGADTFNALGADFTDFNAGEGLKRSTSLAILRRLLDSTYHSTFARDHRCCL